MVQVSAVVVVQFRRVVYALINPVLVGQVLAKGVKEVEVVELLKVHLRKVALYKGRVVQSQQPLSTSGVLNKAAALLHAYKLGPRLMIRTSQAELPDAAADIQYPYASTGLKKVHCLSGYSKGCPVHGVQLLDSRWVQQAEVRFRLKPFVQVTVQCGVVQGVHSCQSFAQQAFILLALQ